MLEGTVLHEDMPTSSDGSDVVEGRVTASSSTPDWDTEDSTEDHGQVAFSHSRALHWASHTDMTAKCPVLVRKLTALCLGPLLAHPTQRS